MTPASSIIQRAADVTQDLGLVRWTAREWVRWLNDGQRAVQVQRPDATSETVTVTLAAGTRQSLESMDLTPAPAKLIEVLRNVAPASAKLPVRMVSRKLLDLHTPNWHAAAPSLNVRHFTFDPRDSNVFYVDPPAPAAPLAAQVQLTYSAYPTDVPQPAADAAIDGVSGNIFLADSYANALLDYVLYRAFMKDSEYTDAGRAQAHFAAFSAALGADLQATLLVQPQKKGTE